MFARCHLALAGAFLLAASPALAESEQISITVSAAGLDLASPAGRARLDRRVRHAAEKICYTGSGGITARMAYDACVGTTLGGAKEQTALLVARKSGSVKLASNAR